MRKLADSILRNLAHIDKGACLLGGAPRYWELGREVNDLDFYIHVPNTMPVETASLLIQAWVRINTEEMNPDAGEGYGNVPGIRAVLQGEKQGVTCQFIIMSTANHMATAARFSCDICNIMYRQGGIFPTLAFRQAVKKKVINSRSNIDPDENRHVQKMMEYFPDYTFKHNNVVIRHPVTDDSLLPDDEITGEDVVGWE